MGDGGWGLVKGTGGWKWGLVKGTGGWKSEDGDGVWVGEGRCEDSG
jgi:hypothetical protein